MKRTPVSDNCRNREGRLVDTSEYKFEVPDRPAENERRKSATCGSHYATTNVYHNMVVLIFAN